MKIIMHLETYVEYEKILILCDNWYKVWEKHVSVHGNCLNCYLCFAVRLHQTVSLVPTPRREWLFAHNALLDPLVPPLLLLRAALVGYRSILTRFDDRLISCVCVGVHAWLVFLRNANTGLQIEMLQCGTNFFGLVHIPFRGHIVTYIMKLYSDACNRLVHIWLIYLIWVVMLLTSTQMTAELDQCNTTCGSVVRAQDWVRILLAALRFGTLVTPLSHFSSVFRSRHYKPLVLSNYARESQISHIGGKCVRGHSSVT